MYKIKRVTDRNNNIHFEVYYRKHWWNFWNGLHNFQRGNTSIVYDILNGDVDQLSSYEEAEIYVQNHKFQENRKKFINTKNIKIK